MAPRTRLAVIIGSIRPDRFGPTAAHWIASRAREHGPFDVDVVDLADYDIPVELAGNDPDATPPESVSRLGARLGQANAFVVVTPVYNRSYSAALKSAIDWFYGEWALKPVALVSYGGITGGLTAIEHLRDVFSEFHAVPLNSTITLPNFWKLFDHDGRPVDAAELGEWAGPVLDQLDWWAQTLGTARLQRPYPGLDFAVADESGAQPEEARV